MRDYLADEPELQNKLLGSSADGSYTGSKVRISDAFFTGNVIDTELRPRVKINRETGTCQTVQTKGGQNWSGQKFEMESVAAGSEFTFKLYLYEREHEYEATIERILGALQAGNIQLGGQKSNGCGYVEFKELLKIDYDMTREKDRKLWSQFGIYDISREKCIADPDFTSCIGAVRAGTKQFILQFRLICKVISHRSG